MIRRYPKVRDEIADRQQLSAMYDRLYEALGNTPEDYATVESRRAARQLMREGIANAERLVMVTGYLDSMISTKWSREWSHEAHVSMHGVTRDAWAGPADERPVGWVGRWQTMAFVLDEMDKEFGEPST